MTNKNKLFIIELMRKSLVKYSFVLLGLFNVAFAFTDVPAEDPHQAIFSHLRDVKIMPPRADGRFAPNDFVTKAEALTFALRAGGIAIPSNFNPLLIPNDVDPNSWFAPVIARAKELKITNPKATSFNPNRLTTKAEFLAFLFRSTRVDFHKLMSKTQVVAPDVALDSWMAPHFRYAFKFGVAHKTSDGLYLPFKNLTRREIAVLTYRQLQIFHGDAATSNFLQLQTNIRQFMTLIRNNKSDEATKHLHTILTLSQKLSLKKNDRNAVAAKALSRSLKHFVSALRAIKYNKRLQAIESLNLAEKYAQRAIEKSEKIAPNATQISTVINETLDNFLSSRFAFK